MGDVKSFISYRRDDAIVVGNVDRIYEQLSTRFGGDSVGVATISRTSTFGLHRGLSPWNPDQQQNLPPNKKDATFGLAPKVR